MSSKTQTQIISYIIDIIRIAKEELPASKDEKDLKDTYDFYVFGYHTALNDIVSSLKDFKSTYSRDLEKNVKEMFDD